MCVIFLKNVWLPDCVISLSLEIYLSTVDFVQDLKATDSLYTTWSMSIFGNLPITNIFCGIFSVYVFYFCFMKNTLLCCIIFSKMYHYFVEPIILFTKNLLNKKGFGQSMT